jgi:hypothetical protein
MINKLYNALRGIHKILAEGSKRSRREMLSGEIKIKSNKVNISIRNNDVIIDIDDDEVINNIIKQFEIQMPITIQHILIKYIEIEDKLDYWVISFFHKFHVPPSNEKLKEEITSAILNNIDVDAILSYYENLVLSHI